MSTKPEPELEPSFPDTETDTKPRFQNAESGATVDRNKRKADTGGADAADAKRAKTDGALVQRNPVGEPREHSDPPKSKCDAFWYEDGNIVIVVEDTAFKLYKARLSKYSTVFAARFAEDDGTGRPSMEGCPVYEVTGLSAEDFKQFLEALETPFVFASKHPSQMTCISILRASKALDCPTTRAFAVDKLRLVWPHDQPKLPGGRLNTRIAIQLIQVSRECGVPELRKRPFYELVRSNLFWKTLRENRQAVPLPDSDLVALLTAREELQHLFMALILEPPYGTDSECPNLQQVRTSADPKLVKVCAQKMQKGWGRRANWRMNMMDNGDLMVGKSDPLGHVQALLSDRLKVVTNAGWCSTCVQERMKAWQEAQVQWWGMLDKWLP